MNKGLAEAYIVLLDAITFYFNSPEEWNIEQYIQQAKQVGEYIDNIDFSQVQNIENLYINSRDLLYLKEFCMHNQEDKKIIMISQLAFHYYALREKILFDSDMWAERANTFIDKIKDYYFESNLKELDGYYKNLIMSNYSEEFEKILCFLRNELKMYEINLIHCKKITEFLTQEFSEKGIYITHTIFVNNYLNNAVNSMILTITKMYLDASDIGKKENCGIKYLQSYVGKYMSKNYKVILKEELGKASDKIKEVERKVKKLEELRNSLIAHFDIEKIESVKEIRMGIEEFEKVFDLSCEILKILSLKYFEYEDRFSYQMIKIHGFKSFVCENPLLHNPNKYAVTDLDMFFDMLRKDFLLEEK